MLRCCCLLLSSSPLLRLLILLPCCWLPCHGERDAIIFQERHCCYAIIDTLILLSLSGFFTGYWIPSSFHHDACLLPCCYYADIAIIIFRCHVDIRYWVTLPAHITATRRYYAATDICRHYATTTSHHYYCWQPLPAAAAFISRSYRAIVATYAATLRHVTLPHTLPPLYYAMFHCCRHYGALFLPLILPITTASHITLLRHYRWSPLPSRLRHIRPLKCCFVRDTTSPSLRLRQRYAIIVYYAVNGFVFCYATYCCHCHYASLIVYWLAFASCRRQRYHYIRGFAAAASCLIFAVKAEDVCHYLRCYIFISYHRALAFTRLRRRYATPALRRWYWLRRPIRRHLRWWLRHASCHRH